MSDTIAVIRERAENANPGPWKYEPTNPMGGRGGTIWQDLENGAPAGFCVAALMMTSDLDDDLPEQASKNGPFIAHARQDVPALLGVIERMEALLLEAEDMFAMPVNDWKEQIARAKAIVPGTTSAD